MADERQRIDKWLWFARVVKSRTLAQKLALSGRVRVNGERNDSASRLIKPGDTLTIAMENRARVLRVVLPGSRRGPAAEAQALYEDLTPPETSPSATAPAPAPEGRPDKRDRRAIMNLRNRNGFDE